MDYYRQQETGDEIENWLKWPGDKRSIMRTINWNHAMGAKADARLSDSTTQQTWDSQRAGNTNDRLNKLCQENRTALIIEYASCLEQKYKAEKCGIALNTYIKRVRDAHLLFWDQMTQTNAPKSRASASACENVE